MRLCRYEQQGSASVGFFEDNSVVSLSKAALTAGIAIPRSDSLLPFLPGGEYRDSVLRIQSHVSSLPEHEGQQLRTPIEHVKLLVPSPNPTKLLLLAGNYAKHIEEGGARAAERAQTFPYVFMKPPLTTLTHPGDPIRIPKISPDFIDWELELGVVIGRRARAVKEADALNYVAGYTVVNDISDRKFTPNPGRTKREKDGFFDWLHGKWHDTFCPMGPCILPADECPNPQALHMTLTVNETIEQDGSTSEMVFPVAAIIEFISNFVTLEPGDIISTGTTAGVGAAKNKYLRPGDTVIAAIDGIGVLSNPVVAE